MMWIAKIIRSIFFSIDSTLYNFIPTVYNLILSVSRTTVLTQGQIKDFADRIQLIIGVFMLFKVSFSLITYIINPDDFSDKSKGFGKLWVNVIISLVLLVTTPYIFNMSYELQALLLKDNSLANLILGNTSNDTNFLNTAGQQLSFSTMIPFFQPRVVEGLEVCNTLYGRENGKFNSECLDAMKSILDDEKNDDFDDIILENYIVGIERRNVGLTFRLNAINTTIGNNQFLFDYKIPLSTVAAFIVLLVLISFCIDVALRSVKLAFLQLISPIPIISYIDPKQGKDGLFKKWYQMCFSTYLSLFIRLLALYFGMYLINIVITTGFTDSITADRNDDPFVILFMIIGILMFIKQLPKILEGFGLKLDGGGKFQLNPFKKIEEEAFGGKQLLGGAAALGAAGLAGAVNFGSRAFNKKTWTDADGKFNLKSALSGTGKVIGSTIAGQASTLYRGTSKIIKGEKAGKIFSDSYGEAMFSKLIREDNLRKAGLENGSLGERIKFGLGSVGADVARLTGNLNKGQQEFLEADRQDNDIRLREEELARDKRTRLKPYQDYSGYAQKIVDRINNHKVVKDAEEALKDAHATGDDVKIQAARDALDAAKKKVGQDLLASDVEVKFYADQMDILRKSFTELADSRFDYKDTKTGEFLKSSLFNSQNESNLIQARDFAQREEDIKAMKESEDYIQAHDENSRAKLQNASRFNQQSQQAGYKPASGPAQGTPHRGLYNPPSGNGGPPPGTP